MPTSLLSKTDYRTASAKNFVLVGQSNAARIPNEGAHTVFLNNLNRITSSQIINGATGGASIHDNADGGSGYHWDPDLNARGSAYTSLTTAITNNYGSLNAVNADIIFCAEQDAKKIDDSTITKAEFKTALDEFLDERQSESASDYKAFIGLLGRHTSGLDSGYQQANEAIRELIESKTFLHFLCESYDLNMTGSVHREHGADGYDLAMQRAARRVQAIYGVGPSVGTNGPVILSATQSTADIICTVTHDNGDDITVPSGATGMFRVEDSIAGVMTISSIARTNATTITITLSATPTGTVTLYTAYGAMSSFSEDDPPVVMDNATNAMPLRGNVITVS